MMKSIFDGLEKFGFKKKEFDTISVLGSSARKDSAKKNNKNAEIKFDIKDYILQKPYECPICDFQFTSPTLKTGKARLSKIDYDLRPIYENFEPMFYDVIMCNKCGYAAVRQKYAPLSDTLSTMVHSYLSENFIPTAPVEEIDISSALDRYKMALLCAAKRNAKDGERAFICLKLTWLYRIQGDRANELSCMALAYKGFKNAYSTESMPICGLNAYTILFLLAAFSKTLGREDESLRYLSSLIVDRGASDNIRERARDMRDEVNKILAEKGN